MDILDQDFYVISKALSGKLSCMVIGPVISVFRNIIKMFQNKTAMSFGEIKIDPTLKKSNKPFSRGRTELFHTLITFCTQNLQNSMEFCQNLTL